MIELIGGKLKLYGDAEQGKLYFKVNGEFVEIAGMNGQDGKDGIVSLALSGASGEIVVCDGVGGLKSSGLMVIDDSVDINAKRDNCIVTYNVLRMLIRPIIKLLKKGE